MSFTVSYLIGASQKYTTIALWEADAPVDYVTAEQSAAGTFQVASYTQNETLTFVGSGATGNFLGTDSTGAGTGTYIQYSITTGNPTANDTVTGGTSGATCVLSSSNPTATNCIWQGKINAASDNALAGGTISGGTTSAAAYAELTTNTGASFRDNANAQTNALRANAANGCMIASSGNGTLLNASGQSGTTRVSNIQFSVSGAGFGIPIDFGGSFLDNCIIESSHSNYNVPVAYIRVGSTARNCLFVLRAAATDSIVRGANQLGTLINCTVVSPSDKGTSYAFGSNYNTANIKNCAMFGVTNVKTGNSSFTFTTCYTDVASPPAGCTTVAYDTSTGSGFQNITDITRDYRIKSGSGMLNVGTTDATNAATDIVGTARPQGSAYDVGCWELVVPPPVRVMRLFEGFRIKLINGRLIIQQR